MQELCMVMWLVVTGCAPAAGAFWSYLVRTWPWAQGWYKPLPDPVKTAIFCVTAGIIGLGIGALGKFIVGCAWPAYEEIVFMVVLAILSAIGGTLSYLKWQLAESRKANSEGC